MANFSYFMMKSLTINNLEFAQKQQKLVDNLAIFTLKRLSETLNIQAENSKKSTIYFELTGDFKQFRYPSLHLHIKTDLPAICQRCLEEMQIALNLEFNYLISEKIVDELEENDEMDWLEVSKEMDVFELIEDELLLALPYAPVHETNCAKNSMQSGEKPNPFAVLKGKIK
jgi:uncharacterized protein